MHTSDFKFDYSFEQRLEESSRVLIKFPDRRPIICERTRKTDLPKIDKKKYLVPYELTIGQFIYVIRKRMQLKPEEAIFLFINNKTMSSNSIIGNVYEYEKDVDGFLYIQYTKESTFG
jgi:GABA(A) receptor-associated protein